DQDLELPRTRAEAVEAFSRLTRGATYDSEMSDPQPVAANLSGKAGLTSLFLPSARWPLALLTVLLCTPAGRMPVSLVAVNNWDLSFSHLYASWAYWHGRYLSDIGPAQFQGFFNPTADFLFYVLTSSSLNAYPRVIALIMGAVHGINAALIL